MFLEVLTLQFVYGSSEHVDKHTGYFYTCREQFKAQELPAYHLESAAGSGQGLRVGREIVAVLGTLFQECSCFD